MSYTSDNGDTDSTSEMLDKEERGNTQDKYKIVLFMFYCLGSLTLVPQNFYTTANDYWMYKFRDPNSPFTYNASDTNRTQLQTNFTSYFSIASNASMVAGLVVTIMIIKIITLQKRLVGTLFLMLLLFTVTITFIPVNTDSWQVGFLIISLVIGSLLTGIGACFMISMFQLAGKFPPEYLGALLSGQSLCGIVAALVQILSLAVAPSSKINALIYFSTGAIFVLAVITMFVTVSNNVTFFIEYFNKEEEGGTQKIEVKYFKIVVWKIKFILGAMVLTLGSSVMVHPGVTSLVASSGLDSGKRWNASFFVPVCTFLLYNVMDFIGRECALHFKKLQPKNANIIFGLSILRMVFIPLIMLCNAQPRSHLPVVFSQDYVYGIFIFIFSFSNGYLVNLSILTVPKITKPEELKIAMILIVLFIIVVMGTCVGLSQLMIKAL